MILYRVWSVRFNHFHDQLVLTASSDSRVILNNVSSISSEPYGKLIDDLDADDDDDIADMIDADSRKSKNRSTLTAVGRYFNPIL